jgi:hypothetical protein
MDLHKTNTKWLVHSWSTFGAKTSHEQLGLTRFTMTQTWVKPPPSPLKYILCLSMRPTSKWHFVLGLLNRNPEIPRVGTPMTLGAHNFVCRPWIEMRFKESCSPYQQISNNVLHATCMQGNRVDSQLLVVESQIANLTPGLSFGHNLCFRCLNGSCKPI